MMQNISKQGKKNTTKQVSKDKIVKSTRVYFCLQNNL
jgi:hypothetical protein